MDADIRISGTCCLRLEGRRIFGDPSDTASELFEHFVTLIFARLVYSPSHHFDCQSGDTGIGWDIENLNNNRITPKT